MSHFLTICFSEFNLNHIFLKFEISLKIDLKLRHFKNFNFGLNEIRFIKMDLKFI